MVLFKDLAKTPTDLLTRDFPHTFPLDVELKSVSGPLTLTATACMTGGSNDATLTAAYTNGGIRSSAKVGANASTFDLNYALPTANKLAGLSFHAKHDVKKGKPITELASEYVTGNCHSRVSFFPLVNNVTASTLFGFGKNNCKLGAEVTSKLDGSNIQYSLGASSCCPTRGISFSLRTAPTSIRVPDEFLFDAHLKKGDVDVAVRAKAKTDFTADVGFVMARKINSDLGYKVKFAENKAALAITQKLSPHASVSVGLEHDGKADGLKMGTKLFFAQ